MAVTAKTAPAGLIGRKGLAAEAVNVTDKVTYDVYAWGWAPPRCEPREGVVASAMTEITAPAWPDTPGQWGVTIVYTVKGPHDMRVFNADGYHTINTFAGDVPVFDSDKRRLLIPERWNLELQKMRDIMQTTPWLGPPENSVAGYVVVAPTTKQAAA